MSVKPPLVAVHGLSLHYGERMILNQVDLAVHEGEIVTLIGPNGAGKSSLVRIMLGLQKPSHGKVERRPGVRIGYVPQRLQIDPVMPLTVRRFLTLTQGFDTTTLQDSLCQVGADHLLDAQLVTLSGGETQRILLARALLRKPQLMFLDEPTQGVDVNSQDELYDLVAQLRDQHGCGILMVSHDLHLVMARSNRVFCLDQQICCTGKPEKPATVPGYETLLTADSRLAPYSHHHHHSSHSHKGCEQCKLGGKHG